ncbi:MAG: DNA polymerase III subunit delta' [Planctomycetota bacterium]
MSLASLPGQQRLARWLGSALRQGRLGHAYLIVGPEGSGRLRIARAIARAALCHERKTGDSCGACPACHKVDTGNHPDLHEAEPEAGKTQYQRKHIEELCTAIYRRAYQGGAKVFIIKQANLLNPTCANRLLKTLEEPPAGTHFCLLANSLHGLLPTIVSRCQTLRPVPMPRDEIERVLVDEHGMDPDQARLAAETSGGWLDNALAVDRQFLGEVRRFIEGALAHARSTDNLELSARLVQLCRDISGEKIPRVLLVRALEMMACLWRDALTYTQTGNGSTDPVCETIASPRSPQKLVDDLQAFAAAASDIRGYVTPELVLDILFLSIAPDVTETYA